MHQIRIAAALLNLAALALLLACTKQTETSQPAVAVSSPNPVAPTQASVHYPTLDNPALLAAFRRGAAESVPDFLRLAAMDFQIIEGTPPAYLVKGTVTYELGSDTFKEVDRIGPFALGPIAVLERVRQAGDKVPAEFNLRLIYDSPDDALSPPLPADLASIGKPRSKEWRRAVMKDSAAAAEAAKHAEEYVGAKQKLERIHDNVAYAKEILGLVSEDTLRDGAEYWRIVVRRDTSFLGFEEVAQAIDRTNLSGNNAAQRREMARLLGPEVIPEAKRLVDLDHELRGRVRAAEKFFAEF